MSRSSPFKRCRFFTYFLLGIVLGYAFGHILPVTFSGKDPFVSFGLLPNKPPLLALKEPLLFLAVTILGAFGGLLYAMREKKLELPYFETNNILKPGWVSDCLAGIAGAYVVFLIVPGSFPLNNLVEVIQALAVAIVGGYGGRGLMDQVLGDFIAKRIETKVEEKTDQLAQKVEESRNSLVQKVEEKADRIENKVEDNKSLLVDSKQQVEQVEEQAKQIHAVLWEQAEVFTRALTLLERYLDEDLEPTDDEIKEIKELVEKVSPSNRITIFVEAKKVREINAQAENKKPFMVKRTIPVFKALMETDTDAQSLHRYHAQLGYALKDIGEDWERAEAELSKAIKIRRESPDENESFWIYEFNRAICRINLDTNLEDEASLPEVRRQIRDDLHTATQSEKPTTTKLSRYLDKLDKETKVTICKWLKRNSISLEEVGLPKEFCENTGT